MPPRMAPGHRDAAGKSTERSARPPRAQAPSRVSDTEKDRMRLMAARGMSCGQIATALGRSRATVSKHVTDSGLSFDREQTRTATEARVEDAKARRSRLMARLLDEAEADLDARGKPQPDHAFTVKGEVLEGDFMPRPQDRMYLTRSAAALLAEHRHLAEFDTEDSAAGAKSMLAALAAGLAVAADRLEPADG